MYYMAIATKTVTPSLRSAREYCEKPRPPQVLMSSECPQDCYDAIVRVLNGGQSCNSIDECLRGGLPVFSSADWTYYVVAVDRDLI